MQFADLGIEHVQCSTDLATLPYDLSNLIKVGLYISRHICQQICIKKHKLLLGTWADKLEMKLALIGWMDR